MYIGSLNHLVSFSLSGITLSGTSTVPTLRSNGNPLLGESLLIGWEDKIASAVDIRLPFGEKVFVDHVKLTLPTGTQLQCVSLYSGEKSQLLYRHRAETGKYITERSFLLEANQETDLLILEFSGDFSDVGMENLEIFGSIGTDGIFPTPNSMVLSDGWISLETLAAAPCAPGIGFEAAKVLEEKLLEGYGISLPHREDGNVRFLQSSSMEENGYSLTVDAAGVCICARDLRGCTYAVETLLKLIRNGSLPHCSISDSPRMRFRGVHLYLPAREDIPFYKRLVSHILSPMGYNTVFLEIGAGMEFDSHPELNEAYAHAVAQAKAGLWPPFPHDGVAGGKWLTKAEVADLVCYTRRFGIDVIPEVQSLGHVQYMTAAHPEIAEIEAKPENEAELVDTRNEDQRPETFYPHSYCPCNEDAYRILFDILDEIIDVVKPAQYVHMGHDEVYEIGVCPVCRSQDPAQLLAKDICRIHSHLAQKGLKMMMWADMLQPVTQYRTSAAIDLIPKDILLLDFIWYFHLDKDIEDNLLRKGFQVIFGNMYSSHFPRYEQRISKEGILGAQTSTWVACSAEALNREGKLYEFLRSAQMLWSDSYSESYKFTYDRMIKARIPMLREQLLGERYPSRHPDAVFTSIGKQALCYPPQEIPKADVFPVEGCFDSFLFTHSTARKLARIPWLPLEIIGSYLVTYADGMVLEIPLTYGGNICHWNRRQNEPFPHSYYRHNGYCATFLVDSRETKTQDGENVCVYQYEWLNPRRDVHVRSIRLVEKPQCNAGILTESITGIRI